VEKKTTKYYVSKLQTYNIQSDLSMKIWLILKHSKMTKKTCIPDDLEHDIYIFDLLMMCMKFLENSLFRCYRNNDEN